MNGLKISGTIRVPIQKYAPIVFLKTLMVLRVTFRLTIPKIRVDVPKRIILELMLILITSFFLNSEL